jgi:hypothetical protein
MKKLFSSHFLNLTIAFLFAVVFLGFNTKNNVVVAATCPNLSVGEEIKVAGKPAIYVLDAQYKIRYYPSGFVYKSWKDRYSYTTITDECLRSLSSPTQAPFAINYRPGSVLVKGENSNQLYVIEPNNVLAPISYDAATAFYGNTVPTVLTSVDLVNYTKLSGSISGGYLVPGMVIWVNSTYYYVNKYNQLQEFTYDGWLKNNIPSQFVRPVAASLIQNMTRGNIIRDALIEINDQTQSRVSEPMGTSTNPPVTTPPVTTPSAQYRDASLQPFDAYSPWNLPLATDVQLQAANDACTADLIGNSAGTSLNVREWSHAVYTANNSDPLVNITLDRRGGQGNGFVAQIRVPANATPSLPDLTKNPDSDAHLHIIDPEHRYVFEMWKAKWVNATTISAWGYTKNDLYSSGVGQGGERAYGGSALGGLIRKGEINNGIPHALSMAVPGAKLRCCSAVWPAIHVDASASTLYKGSIPMGQLVALPANVDINSLGLSVQAKKIAEALQNYGAYVVDASDDFGFSAETGAASDFSYNIDGELNNLRKYLRCVSNNSATNIGGGAIGAPRRAPLAWPLK